MPGYRAANCRKVSSEGTSGCQIQWGISRESFISGIWLLMMSLALMAAVKAGKSPFKTAAFPRGKLEVMPYAADNTASFQVPPEVERQLSSVDGGNAILADESAGAQSSGQRPLCVASAVLGVTRHDWQKRLLFFDGRLEVQRRRVRKVEEDELQPGAVINISQKLIARVGLLSFADVLLTGLGVDETGRRRRSLSACHPWLW